MTTILQINTSLNAGQGQSSRLASRYVQQRLQREPDARVIVRDLAAEPVPHLSADTFQAFITPPEQRSPEQQAAVDYSDALIAELAEADEVVLGLPMYNFGVPSPLKAYFDHIARAGVTFKYTDTGPVGLLADKPVTVLAARGGQYLGTAKDTQTPYLRDFFGFIGLSDLHFIYAEGLNMGEQAQAQALDAAHQAIEQRAA